MNEFNLQLIMPYLLTSVIVALIVGIVSYISFKNYLKRNNITTKKRWQGSEEGFGLAMAIASAMLIISSYFSIIISVFIVLMIIGFLTNVWFELKDMD